MIDKEILIKDLDIMRKKAYENAMKCKISTYEQGYNDGAHHLICTLVYELQTGKYSND
jgi:hypothetical protein